MKKRNIKALVDRAIRGSKYAGLIERISLFGSYARGEETDENNLDLLVVFDPEAHITLFDLVDIQDALEKALEAKIDLVPRDALSPYLRGNILSQARLVYER